MPHTEFTTFYCALCDRYFLDRASCAAHIQYSSIHPLCEPCGVRFANGHCRRQHWCESTSHHYCGSCEVEFRTAAGLRVHFELAAVHRDDCDDDDDDDDDDDYYEFADTPEWADELGRQMYPEDAEQPADDDFDVPEERPVLTPASSTMTILEHLSTQGEGEDEELDLDEECEYSFINVSAGSSSTIITDADDMSVVVSACVIPAREYAAAKKAKQSAEAAQKAVEDDLAERAASSGILFNCPLCLETPDEVSATRCGHVFCSSCISAALDVKHSCPVCRSPSVPLQLRKLYLSTD